MTHDDGRDSDLDASVPWLFLKQIQVAPENRHSVCFIRATRIEAPPPARKPGNS